MTQALSRPGKAVKAQDEIPRFVHHPALEEPAAETLLGGDPALDPDPQAERGHMIDEVTRATAKRMHYAAYRAQMAHRASETRRWRNRYFVLRDRIVLGNRKLIFRAVRRRLFHDHIADDMIGECYLVLIRAVAAYNPWMGIRFSTYAFTCLMRALSRLSQRLASDRLARHLSLEAVINDPRQAGEGNDVSSGQWQKLAEFLEDDHPLLSEREKIVLLRRFRLSGERESLTLEKIGQDLGISKERVRQVQASALGKLRQAMLGTPAPS